MATGNPTDSTQITEARRILAKYFQSGYGNVVVIASGNEKGELTIDQVKQTSTTGFQLTAMDKALAQLTATYPDQILFAAATQPDGTTASFSNR